METNGPGCVPILASSLDCVNGAVPVPMMQWENAMGDTRRVMKQFYKPKQAMASLFFL